MNLRKLMIVLLVLVLGLPMARAQDHDVVRKRALQKVKEASRKRARKKLKEQARKDAETKKREKLKAEKAEADYIRRRNARRARRAAAKAQAKKRKAARHKLWGDFRKMTWGSPIVAYPAMVLADDKGEWKFYRHKKNDLVIGAAKLKQITYGFYNARFYSVTIEAEGKMNSAALKDAVFATYGKGHRKNKTVHEWAWRSGREAPKYLSMALKYGDDMKGASLILTYAPNKNKTAADKKKAAKGAVRDF